MKTKIYIDDVVGSFSFFDSEDDITERNIRQQLDSANGDIEIHINSPGGDVFEGEGIYNQIKDYSKGNVTVVIGSVAASIASIIAFAGDSLPMVRINSKIMIHNPKTFAMGDEAEMLRTADALRTVKSSLIAVYENAVPDSDLDFDALMNETKWFTAQEAIDAGIAIAFEEADDEVTNIAPFEISNAMSYEDLMKAFCAAKAENQIDDGDSPDELEDIPEPTEMEPITNEAARLRYTEILAEDVQAGTA